MYIVNIESCFSKCFFDEVLAGAEGYDEHVQGLTIHQLEHDKQLAGLKPIRKHPSGGWAYKIDSLNFLKSALEKS